MNNPAVRLALGLKPIRFRNDETRLRSAIMGMYPPRQDLVTPNAWRSFADSLLTSGGRHTDCSSPPEWLSVMEALYKVFPFEPYPHAGPLLVAVAWSSGLCYEDSRDYVDLVGGLLDRHANLTDLYEYDTEALEALDDPLQFALERIEDFRMARESQEAFEENERLVGVRPPSLAPLQPLDRAVPSPEAFCHATDLIRAIIELRVRLHVPDAEDLAFGPRGDREEQIAVLAEKTVRESWQVYWAAQALVDFRVDEQEVVQLVIDYPRDWLKLLHALTARNALSDEAVAAFCASGAEPGMLVTHGADAVAEWLKPERDGGLSLEDYLARAIECHLSGAP